MWKRVVVATVIALAGAAVASAQATGGGQTPTGGGQTSPGGGQAPSTPAASTAAQPDQDSPETGETRPATTTFLGDTGLWFVPIGEVLPAKKWSLSAYRVNYDYNQGFTDVSNWPLTSVKPWL
jgi:hypothetical protein